VTRLGEFLPIGRLLTWADFLLLFQRKRHVLILRKGGFGYILAEFLQTHLVTQMARESSKYVNYIRIQSL
jgi:hypothetical protein